MTPATGTAATPEPDAAASAAGPTPSEQRAGSEPTVLTLPIEPTGEGVAIPEPAPHGAANESGTVTAIAPVVADEDHPFSDGAYRASTHDAELDVAAVRSPIGNVLARFTRNKRNVAIAAGGAVLLIVVLVFAMGGSSKPSKQKANKPTAKTATQHESSEPPADPPAETDQPTEPPTEAPAAATDPPPTETPTEAPAVATDQPPTETATETHPTAATDSTEKKIKKGPTLAGKQVVLEYDTQAREARPVPNAPKDDQAAISKARTSYAAGNQKLFAGDADSAIKNYRQALAYYPAYVAGYRGLGLAYAQKGDKPKALQALRTYVNTVPGAKDASLIRKRIQMLSK